MSIKYRDIFKDYIHNKEKTFSHVKIYSQHTLTRLKDDFNIDITLAQLDSLSAIITKSFVNFMKRHEKKKRSFASLLPLPWFDTVVWNRGEIINLHCIYSKSMCTYIFVKY